MLRIPSFALLCILAAAPAFASVTTNPVSERDAKMWACYATPLPKQMQISGEIVLPKGSVSLEIAGADDNPVYDEIRRQFSETLGAGGESVFRVVISVGGKEAETLRNLANSSQAYSIETQGDSVSIYALGPHGAYYGWKTLQQLLNAKAGSETIKIPVLQVTDWPDMDRRGIWGVDNFNHLRWLSDRKMNHMEQISSRGIDQEGRWFTHSKPGQDALKNDSSKYAIHFAPVVLHLEQVLSDDMIKRYPEMKAVNSTHPRAMCYAQPKTLEMISEWIYDSALLSNCFEVDVWMTENILGKVGCQCDTCKKEHHCVNEARTIIKAWERAKQKLGRNITLYILTSESSEEYNRDIFSEIPKDVRVWYYHSLLTYNTIRQPMLRPYLAEEAKKGRWMGVCPNLDAWTHTNQPFHGAEFIKYRMTEFINKHQSGLLGYPTPRIHYNKFNVEAAAEWTWNLNGRNTRDFAYSYAVRQGYKNPDKFAEWSETLGTVSWDVYGSSWPFGQTREIPEPAKVTLKKGTLQDLGFVWWDCYPSPWGNVANEAKLNADVAAAQKALRIAREMGIPELWYESLVVDGYIRSMKSLYEIRKIAPRGGGKFAPEARADAGRHFRNLFAALEQSIAYLPKWEDCVRGATEQGFNFTDKPIKTIREVMDGLRQTALDMGAEL